MKQVKEKFSGKTGEVWKWTWEKRYSLNSFNLRSDIDIAETIPCITGKWIRRIHPDLTNPTKPGEVEFEDGTRINLKNPPWEIVKPLIWW